MSLKKKTMTGKSPYIMLALGLVMGGLAVTTVPHLVSSAQAQSDYALKPISGISAENMAALRALDNSFASLATYIEPSVVHIESVSDHSVDMFGRRMGKETGVGTGVIYRPDGWIITNDHVVAGFDKVTVKLADGRTFTGTVKEANDNDLAVIKIDAHDLQPAQFGDSASVRPGQFAMAVGSPFDLDQTVTVGHISALGRDQTIPDPRTPIGVRGYSDMIQTDTPINMGNSGGPLINVDGQVIGINSAILSESGGSVGIGFAIPSNQARMIADELIEKGVVTTAFLGLVPDNLPDYVKKEKNIDGGALVKDAPEAGGPAANAGIQKDDIITKVGSFPVRNEQDVRNSMFHYAPGTSVSVELLRGDQHKTVQVKLGDKKAYNAELAKKLKSQNQGPQDGQGDMQSPFPNIPDMKDFGNIIPHRGTPPNGNRSHSGRPMLGVTVENPTDSDRTMFNIPNNVQGVVVTSVMPGSVAESLGLEPGCIIQKLGDKQIRTPQDLQDAMKGVNWGDSKDLQFVKFGSNSRQNETVTATFQ